MLNTIASELGMQIGRTDGRCNKERPGMLTAAKLPAPPLPAPSPAAKEPGTSLTDALLLNLAHTPLTMQELDAARN